MYPTSVEIVNWQSFKGKHKADLPTGLIRVTGNNLDQEGASSNRSGKTAFLNTFLGVLCNRSSLVSRSLNLINDESDSAYLKLNFDNNTTVERYFKDKEKNNSILFNGNNITQEELEKKLGMDFNSLISCNFFGTAYSDFLEKILRKPAEAKELLTSLMPNLQVFDNALLWVKNQIKIIDENLNKLNTNLNILIGRIQSYEGMDFKSKIKSFEDKRKYDLNQIFLKIDEYEKDLDGRLKNVDEKGFEEKYKAFKEERSKLQTVYNNLNTKEYNEKNKRGNLNNKIENLIKEIKVLQLGTCPYCKQKLPIKTETLNEKNKELEATKKEFEYISLETFKNKTLLAKKDLDNFDQKDDDFTELGRAIREKESLIKDITRLKSDYDRFKQALNPYIEEEKSNNIKLEESRKEEKKLNENIQKQKDLSQYYLFWEKGFGPRGIKNFIFDEVVFRLTDLSQNFLDEMTEGSIQIKFDPRKEKKSGGFTETIGLEISSRGNSREFLTWSQSERKKVSLAVDLAMNQMLSEMFNSNFEFAVFDETFDGLDQVGIEFFCKILRKQLGRIKSIFVVSHSPYGEEYFDSTIVVTKENGISRIENSENRKLLEMSLPKVTLDKSMGKLKRRIK
jgi:DNA repair exonuclease SbcCD ATPase subunit